MNNTGLIKGSFGYANNDHWHIKGVSTGDDSGYLEIATMDNVEESILVRQYNWTPDPHVPVRTLTLLNGSGNTYFPGQVYTSSGWFRTYGDNGWYSETHGGGYYMSDTTWLRAYNNKNIYRWNYTSR